MGVSTPSPSPPSSLLLLSLFVQKKWQPLVGNDDATRLNITLLVIAN